MRRQANGSRHLELGMIKKESGWTHLAELQCKVDKVGVYDHVSICVLEYSRSVFFSKLAREKSGYAFRHWYEILLGEILLMQMGDRAQGFD